MSKFMQKYELTVTHGEAMSHVGVETRVSDPLSPHCSAYTLMN